MNQPIWLSINKPAQAIIEGWQGSKSELKEALKDKVGRGWYPSKWRWGDPTPFTVPHMPSNCQDVKRMTHIKHISGVVIDIDGATGYTMAQVTSHLETKGLDFVSMTSPNHLVDKGTGEVERYRFYLPVSEVIAFDPDVSKFDRRAFKRELVKLADDLMTISGDVIEYDRSGLESWHRFFNWGENVTFHQGKGRIDLAKVLQDSKKTNKWDRLKALRTPVMKPPAPTTDSFLNPYRDISEWVNEFIHKAAGADLHHGDIRDWSCKLYRISESTEVVEAFIENAKAPDSATGIDAIRSALEPAADESEVEASKAAIIGFCLGRYGLNRY